MIGADSLVQTDRDYHAFVKRVRAVSVAPSGAIRRAALAEDRPTHPVLVVAEFVSLGRAIDEPRRGHHGPDRTRKSADLAARRTIQVRGARIDAPFDR